MVQVLKPFRQKPPPGDKFAQEVLQSFSSGFEKRRKSTGLGKLLRSVNPNFAALPEDVQGDVINSAVDIGPAGIRTILRSGAFEDLAPSIPDIEDDFSTLISDESGTSILDGIMDRLRSFAGGGQEISDDSLNQPDEFGELSNLSGSTDTTSEDIGSESFLRSFAFSPGLALLGLASSFIEGENSEVPIDVEPVLDTVPRPGNIRQTRGRQPKKVENRQRRPADLLKLVQDTAKNNPNSKDIDLSLKAIKKEAKELGIKPNELVIQIAQQMGIE